MFYGSRSQTLNAGDSSKRGDLRRDGSGGVPAGEPGGNHPRVGGPFSGPVGQHYRLPFLEDSSQLAASCSVSWPCIRPHAVIFILVRIVFVTLLCQVLDKPRSQVSFLPPITRLHFYRAECGIPNACRFSSGFFATNFLLTHALALP